VNPQSSPAGGCGEDPADRGSTVRVVRDPAANALVTALFCCEPFPNSRWCLRVKGHAGGCIAWGLRPLKHITDDNHSRAASIARHPSGKAL
jgi:hypothetical protein